MINFNYLSHRPNRTSDDIRVMELVPVLVSFKSYLYTTYSPDQLLNYLRVTDDLFCLLINEYGKKRDLSSMVTEEGERRRVRKVGKKRERGIKLTIFVSEFTGRRTQT